MDYFIETPCFNAEQTLDSGQCFRWSKAPDGCWRGVAGSRPLKLRQEAGGVTLLDVREAELPFWREYFDEDTDYEAIIRQFSADETLRRASESNKGLRVLRQEPFETLISFIISQNNNIPRIRGIISRLCETFGDPLGGEFSGEYGFPSAKTLAGADEADFAPLRAGFRVRYILDAARRVSSGGTDLDGIYGMDYESGKAELKKIVGVGDKVADCVLLFAYHKTEAFPSDVWIKRITAAYYKDGLPECMGNYKGIAQQYLFEYFRNDEKMKEQKKG